jgi:hypothetical protein
MLCASANDNVTCISARSPVQGEEAHGDSVPNPPPDSQLYINPSYPIYEKIKATHGREREEPKSQH